ncbi:hypothetical protein AB6T38_14795 [Aliiglaciecola sp. SL4]|uniref:hypothetical protein n=1 Tax=Aliiglaciecola sp. SL4 TaxID=3239806 RepID=UPI00355B49BD
MWSWHALLFSWFIAVFIAMSAPAHSVDNPLNSPHIPLSVDVHAGQLDNAQNQHTLSQLTQILSADYIISKQQTELKKRKGTTRKKSRQDHFQSKFPPEFFKINRDIRWPPFERCAYSAFSSPIQNEPIFVLAYEFLPEILGRQHFLAAPVSSVDTPWFLRPDAANNHSKLGGWKDGNTLYSGAITYLS